MGKILTITQFFSLFSAISWKQPMFEMPTLFTSIETSNPWSSFMILSKKWSLSHSEKSATMCFVQIQEFSYLALIFFNASSILPLLRATMQILKPREASSSQNPRPIPSLPPVTTAHVLAPYLYLQFLLGKTILIKAQSILAIQRMKTMPPIAARKQMKLQVDCSILLNNQFKYELPLLESNLPTFIQSIQLQANGQVLSSIIGFQLLIIVYSLAIITYNKCSIITHRLRFTLPPVYLMIKKFEVSIVYVHFFNRWLFLTRFYLNPLQLIIFFFQLLPFLELSVLNAD